MLAHILYALEYCNKTTPIERHHVSNYAMDELFVEGVFGSDMPRLIASCYEDRNLSSIDDANAVAEIVSTLMPDKWVLIDTGDYIMSADGNPDKETYDPHYNYYLVSKDVFDNFKDMLFNLDRKWRSEKEKQAIGL